MKTVRLVKKVRFDLLVLDQRIGDAVTVSSMADSRWSILTLTPLLERFSYQPVLFRRRPDLRQLKHRAPTSCLQITRSNFSDCASSNDQTMNNLTAVLNAIDDIKLENRPVPEPKEDEVLIRMGCVGICGSDVHYWTKGRIGNFILEKPMVIGHEASGTVVKTGAAVTNLKPGDRVAIEPGVPCRLCSVCKEGRYNLCAGMVFCATPPYDGNLAHYYKHPADFCFKLPDNVSLEEGALLEPLSVGVHACRKAGVSLGSVVLILGAGPIGLVTLLTARAMSASKIIILDVLQHRLDTAKKCGADYTLASGKEEPEALAKRVIELLGEMPDKTIDCVGLESTAKLGLEATRPGGKYVLVGMGSQEMKLPLVNASIKEVDIIGSFRYCNDYRLALEMVATGKADVKQLITHNFNIEETVKAFQTARDNVGNPIKILIHCK